MFRRAKTETPAGSAAPAPETDAVRPGGKGRPTPTRKEAEAAARARAKAAMDAKSSTRRKRAESSQRIRQGIKEGDPRYLPARDQGPVRRFVRDYVDQRLSMGEFALPLLFVSLVMSSLRFQVAGSAVMQTTLLLVVVDSLILRWRLRRELRRRFPGESLKGTTFYAYMRSLQVRFLRLPKPQVKLGQRLPERY